MSYSVVNVDDIEGAGPGDTITAVLPHLAMGQWAIEQLGDAASPRQRSFPLTKLECPLIERDSVRAPPGVASTPD